MIRTETEQLLFDSMSKIVAEERASRSKAKCRRKVEMRAPYDDEEVHDKDESSDQDSDSEWHSAQDGSSGPASLVNSMYMHRPI